MRDQLQKRVAELNAEYATGQRMLADLDARRAELQQTLLRISGAIQVLSELLADDQDVTGAGAPAGPVPAAA
jgi:hypothetical protein